MKTRPLKLQILLSQLIVVVLLSTSIAIAGAYFIKKDVIDKAQIKVRHDLNVAREVYKQEVRNIENVIRLTAQRYIIRDAISTGNMQLIENDLDKIRKAESLDILTLTDKNGVVILRARNPLVIGDNQAKNELVKHVLDKHEPCGATKIVPKQDLLKEGQDLVDQAYIEYIKTPRAKQTDANSLTSAMCIKAAAPVFDINDNLIGVLYGGILLNKNYDIVDKVKEIVYQGIQYKGQDVGTVTIFQNDVRISTNVKNKQGNRAIGTRVSEEVYNQVLVNAQTWDDKAFVVNNWYKTAYEPIRNIEGNVIGMLYVGTLEQPFIDIARNTSLMLVLIIAGATAIAVIISYIIDADISKNVRNLLTATGKLSDGEYGLIVKTTTSVTELNELAKSFNEMSLQLKERDERLTLSNEMLTDLNKRYIELIGFVSHELKGMLASAIMNAYAIKDGFLGLINFKQKKAIDSVTRNLDYLTAIVQKFLNLGRIEKGELNVNRIELDLNTQVIKESITSFAPLAEKKKMQIVNEIQDGLIVNADCDLMLIVFNNLIGNAIKYGNDKGKVILSSREKDGLLEVEVYNDSVPIREEQKNKLFNRFSRLDTPETKKVKGTGLGLYITKQIIEKHGGNIHVEPREKGNSFIFAIEKGFKDGNTIRTDEKKACQLG